jgi:hypothetical protein
LEGRSSQDMSRVSTRAHGTVGGEVSSVGAAVVVDPPQVHILQLRRMEALQLFWAVRLKLEGEELVDSMSSRWVKMETQVRAFEKLRG